jgi:sulfide:quinone oxidoreductase
MNVTEISQTPSAPKSLHHRVVIVGGGAAGITVAAQLISQDSTLDILGLFGNS